MYFYIFIHFYLLINLLYFLFASSHELYYLCISTQGEKKTNQRNIFSLHNSKSVIFFLSSTSTLVVNKTNLMCKCGVDWQALEKAKGQCGHICSGPSAAHSSTQLPEYLPPMSPGQWRQTNPSDAEEARVHSPAEPSALVCSIFWRLSLKMWNI